MGRFADLVDVLGLFWGLFAPQKTLSHDRDPPQPALYLLLIDIDPPDLRRWVVASSPCSANCNRTRFPLHRKNQQLTGHAEDDGGSVNGSVYGSVDGSGRWKWAMDKWAMIQVPISRFFDLLLVVRSF
ncbi:hypothetical protein B0I72DRAFT_21762 [Yarrowia lipolytica]|uniref:Uncharacterized protein n=1 Tax=Yarrowia lipolytica TaxID=4952 RepID=A0A371C8X0_YARLL|nr:hypothetical protein B0I71DRAFT_29974 [Yarrowia lipolytica]RDW29496.1 hypothetical protein B0I72DRAFT_21762 [Yarrowia lipolytica]RDW41792.1 hypothetical protein B0I73DRAFT_44476 [Yarrowia lipolytica]RDW46019.1 hypothetical protein B0I74DRAFT_31729 [Yarrowia lipolytica]RDW54058.1 hypothetical protein B0I75DRAFT_15048 [Yarrowia lipolytica]